MAALGIRNNNPGNAEYGKATQAFGATGVGDGGRFARFPTAEQGIGFIAARQRTYEAHGLMTVRQRISKWSPPEENGQANTDAYIAAVARSMGISPDEPFSMTNRVLGPAFIGAMVHHENGYQPYTDEQIMRGHLVGLRENERVAKLQKFFKDAGFDPGVIDGAVGLKTDAAARGMQAAMNKEILKYKYNLTPIAEDGEWDAGSRGLAVALGLINVPDMSPTARDERHHINPTGRGPNGSIAPYGPAGGRSSFADPKDNFVPPSIGPAPFDPNDPASRKQDRLPVATSASRRADREPGRRAGFGIFGRAPDFDYAVGDPNAPVRSAPELFNALPGVPAGRPAPQALPPRSVPTAPIPRPNPERFGALPDAPAREAMRAYAAVVEEIEEIERLLKTDRRAYFRDEKKQERYRELLALREKNRAWA